MIANDIMKTQSLRRLFYLMMGLIITICAMRDSFGGGLENSFQFSPENVVEKFCELDAKGLRLSSDTRGEIDKLLAWGEEEGYDEMSIIEGFRVDEAKLINSKAIVPAVYRMVGSTDAVSFSKTPNSKKKIVINYKLEKQAGAWKITEPVVAPFVNWNVAVNHLKLLQRSETTRKKQLDLLIKIIEDASKR
jgi:hypothetical protein